MVASGPGWYVDPGAPDRLRYYDGAAWTAHTAAPAPVLPSSPPAPGRYGRAGAPGRPPVTASASASATMLTPMPATSPRRAGRYALRLALVAGVTVVAVIVLVVVLGVSRTVLDATAPGTGARPLAGTTDLKVPGWRPATDKAAIDLTEAMRLRLAGTPGLGAGASKTYAAAFRPTRARAAAGAGPGLIVLWIPKPDRLDVVNLVAGFRDGLRSQGYEDTSVSRTAAGAQMVCGTTPIAASCAWALSGAGVIMVAEFGATATAARTDLLAVAKTLGGE